MKKYGYYKWSFDYRLFAAQLKGFCAEHEIAYSELDEIAGVGHGTTSRVVNGAKNAKMDTWLALANATDMDVRKLFIID